MSAQSDDVFHSYLHTVVHVILPECTLDFYGNFFQRKWNLGGKRRKKHGNLLTMVLSPFIWPVLSALTLALCIWSGSCDLNCGVFMASCANAPCHAQVSSHVIVLKVSLPACYCLAIWILRLFVLWVCRLLHFICRFLLTLIFLFNIFADHLFSGWKKSPSMFSFVLCDRKTLGTVCTLFDLVLFCTLLFILKLVY